MFGCSYGSWRFPNLLCFDGGKRKAIRCIIRPNITSSSHDIGTFVRPLKQESDKHIFSEAFLKASGESENVGYLDIESEQRLVERMTLSESVSLIGSDLLWL